MRRRLGFLATDDQDRETLSFLDGHVAPSSRPRSAPTRALPGQRSLSGGQSGGAANHVARCADEDGSGRCQMFIEQDRHRAVQVQTKTQGPAPLEGRMPDAPAGDATRRHGR